MASTSATELQALLRFLTQEAKLPLATAMAKVALLRKQSLNSPEVLAKADIAALEPIFDDEKVSKQVINAAKRHVNPKKRSATTPISPSSKRTKSGEKSSDQIEAELALPVSDASVEDLQRMQIETNRAPLFLAFTVSVLKHTMPEQPLSSRLSLAQAVVSLNSQSKAKSIGLTTGVTAEDEGWGEGQPKLRIMTREIAVMRRHVAAPAVAEQDGLNASNVSASESHDAFWGIDLEAMRRAKGPLVAGKAAGGSGPPIHSPQSARAYLLKSIVFRPLEDGSPIAPTGAKKKPATTDINVARERAVAATLRAVDLVCESWSTLSNEELQRRANSWYMQVRPDVAGGQAGWGQRGIVRLGEILKFRRDQ